MPKITAIRRNVHRAARCSVFVDDEFFAACPIDVAATLGLKKGLEMTPDLERRLRSEDRRMVLRQKSYRFATYKPRTERQVSDHLVKLEATPEEVVDVLGWLREFRLIDDVAYAQRFLDAARERKPLSPRAARQKLQVKGVPESVIDEAIARAFDEDQTLDAARRVAEKKLRTLRGNTPEQRQRLSQFLQYRGYPWQIVRTILTEMLPLFLLAVATAGAQSADCGKMRLPDAINRFQPTTLPVLGPDGSLYLDRKLHPDNRDGITDPDDVWMSTPRSSLVWSEPVHANLMAPGLQYPDALFNFTPDGLMALVVGRYGHMGADTVQAYAVLSRRTIHEPFSTVRVLPVPLTGSNYYGFLSSDHQFCILAQQQPRVDMNLVVTSLTDSLAQPIDLGPTINSMGLEGAPWLANDGRTLYFASNGRSDRRGKADLYMARRTGTDWTTWSEPEHLGSCMNSQEDELAFSLTPSDTVAMIASWDPDEDRPGIYQVTLPKAARPLPYVIVDMHARDELTDEAIADLSLSCDSTQWLSDTVLKRVRCTLPLASTPYTMLVTAPGYDTVRVAMRMERVSSTILHVDTVRLFPIDLPVGSVYFARGSAVLDDAEGVVLDSIVMRFRGTSRSLMVDGYTDEVGSDDFNAALSRKRAQMVADELVRRGFPADRLQVAGRGIERAHRQQAAHPESRRVDIYPRR